MSSSLIPAPRPEDAKKHLPSLPTLLTDTPDAIDVRRRGLNPFFTGVTLGIIAFITGFLFIFAYLVVTYLQYTNG